MCVFIDQGNLFVKTYTLHVPENSSSEMNTLERIRVVSDGFNKWAFIFGFFWFLAKGYLLEAFLIFLFVELGSLFLIHAVGIPSFLIPSLLFIFHLFLGFEAGSLVRWRLRRKGFQERFVVLAPSPMEAEYKGLTSLLNGRNIPDNQMEDQTSLQGQECIVPNEPFEYSPFPSILDKDEKE